MTIHVVQEEVTVNGKQVTVTALNDIKQFTTDNVPVVVITDACLEITYDTPHEGDTDWSTGGG